MVHHLFPSRSIHAMHASCSLHGVSTALASPYRTRSFHCASQKEGSVPILLQSINFPCTAGQVHLSNSSIPLFCLQTVYLHPRTGSLLHMAQVLPASSVPGGHVLLHAVGVAGRLAGREGRAGRGNAALEAVLVEFLRQDQYQLGELWYPLDRKELHTSTRARALAIAACWRTCCITSVFASAAILMYFVWRVWMACLVGSSVLFLWWVRCS